MKQDRVKEITVMNSIEVKNTKVLMALLDTPIHVRMKELITWVSDRYPIVITCAYEDRDYSSVHSTIPCRGLDLRSWIYDDPELIVKDINKNWSYDSKRPEKLCAIYHDVGRGAHIHLQVHNSTKQRN